MVVVLEAPEHVAEEAVCVVVVSDHHYSIRSEERGALQGSREGVCARFLNFLIRLHPGRRLGRAGLRE